MPVKRFAIICRAWFVIEKGPLQNGAALFIEARERKEVNLRLIHPFRPSTSATAINIGAFSFSVRAAIGCTADGFIYAFPVVIITYEGVLYPAIAVTCSTFHIAVAAAS